MISQGVKTNIKAILFDLGNVTVNFNHYLAVEKIKHLASKATEEIYQLFFDSNITGLFEEGKLSPEEFYREVKKLLNFEINYAEFTGIWNGIFFVSPDNLKVQGLIKKFKERFKVILISNINKLHYDYLVKEYAVFNDFDKHVLSYEVGARKPDSLIYRTALKAAGVAIGEAVYIDDREDLVNEGRALGIKSVCFKNYPALLADLSELGLI